MKAGDLKVFLGFIDDNAEVQIRYLINETMDWVTSTSYKFSHEISENQSGSIKEVVVISEVE